LPVHSAAWVGVAVPLSGVAATAVAAGAISNAQVATRTRTENLPLSITVVPPTS
jgi:hypothetical protein